MSWTPEEVAEGKIENALEIDYYADDFEKEMNALDKSKSLFLYCRSGGRSGNAAELLKNAGFVKVYNMEGGYNAFKALK